MSGRLLDVTHNMHPIERRSFDFYDTLMTRIVADPADVFKIVGELLDLPKFAGLRATAEAEARTAHTTEITFDQIYARIPLPDDVLARAKALELQLEHDLLRPIKSVCDRFGSEDIIISDMYHEEDLFRKSLSRYLPDRANNSVLISSVLGMSKADGKMWRHIVNRYPEYKLHIGDNLHSDVAQPRRFGIVGEHFERVKLSRYEAALAHSTFDGSLVAGCSRATRLSLIDASHNHAESAGIETFASVFGPLLLSFSQWIAERCREQGIRRIYFLARDGLLPYVACSILFASQEDLECKYIYASRQALHVPGFTDIESAETWLLDPTPFLSLAIIAERAEVSIEVVQAAANGLIEIDIASNVPWSERHILSKLIRQPVFIEALRSSSKARAGDAYSYYEKSGLFGAEPVAIVDIGWNGRLQHSLRNLRAKGASEGNKVLGLYLCLSKRVGSGPLDELKGFLFEPTDDGEGPLWDQYRSVLEAAMTADHATTIGFANNNHDTIPVFGDPYSTDLQKRIALQRQVIREFVTNIASLEELLSRSVVPPRAVIVENLRRFVAEPQPVDGHAFLGFDLADGQAEKEKQHLVTFRQTARGYLMQGRALGAWPEGTRAVSSDPMLVWAILVGRTVANCKRYAKRLLRRAGHP